MRGLIKNDIDIINMECIEYKNKLKVEKEYVNKNKNIKSKTNYQQYYLNYYNNNYYD